MSDRPWYHLGHSVRAILADLIVALVALALLMEQVRGKDAGERQVPYAGRRTVMVGAMNNGWPLSWQLCVGYYRESSGLHLPRRYDRWPFHVRPGCSVDYRALLFDVAVLLAMLVATSAVTRWWLRLPRRSWQFSLLLMLLLPATVIVFLMMAEQRASVRWQLLGLFFWYACACVAIAIGLLARWAIRRSLRVAHDAPATQSPG